MILIKGFWSLVKLKVRHLLSDTATAFVLVFVLVNVFWSYVFLFTNWGINELDLLNMLGTWFGSIATFSAVVVSLYIARGHHYRPLKITVETKPRYRIVIENFNDFPVLFTFHFSSTFNKSSFTENLGFATTMYRSFRMTNGKFLVPLGDAEVDSPQTLTVDKSGVLLLEFSSSQFVTLHFVPSYPSADMYDLTISTLVYSQTFKKSGSIHDFF